MFANSGGTVILSQSIIQHPQYNPSYEDFNFAILRVTNIQYFPNIVGPAAIAGPNYNLLDNQVVWTIGWGQTWVFFILLYHILLFYRLFYKENLLRECFMKCSVFFNKARLFVLL